MQQNSPLEMGGIEFKKEIATAYQAQGSFCFWSETKLNRLTLLYTISRNTCKVWVIDYEPGTIRLTLLMFQPPIGAVVGCEKEQKCLSIKFSNKESTRHVLIMTRLCCIVYFRLVKTETL